jgi:hypothetical protein
MHKRISEILFGEDGDEIHEFMDAPAKIFGKYHRKYLHDPLTLAFLYAVGGQEAAEHAAAHMLVDKTYSETKRLATKGIKLGIEKFIKELKKINK